MVEEKEMISLIYGFLEGIRAYREAYNRLNNKNYEGKDTKLEEVVNKYKRFEQLLFFLEKMVG
ncbi:MAG: hypothetical protein QW040_01215 [Candidatus Aenigmatarchaeota archaeon]